MTISTSVSSVAFNGNGFATQFPFPFPLLNAGDLQVVLTDNTQSPPVVAVLPASRYAISGIGNPSGGSVAYPASGGAPLAPGQVLTLRRNVQYVQTTSIMNQGGFYPEVIEGALDYLTEQTQQLAEGLSRTVQVPIGMGLDPAAYLSTIQAAQSGAAASAAAAGASAAAAAMAASQAGVSLADGLGGQVNVKWFGAKGDALTFRPGIAIAAGAIALTLSAGPSWWAGFTAADQGKTIAIPGAGAAGGLLTTTIAAVIGPAQVTLAAAAATAVAAPANTISIAYGTDDTAAITAAAALGLPLWFPFVGINGGYLTTAALTITVPSLRMESPIIVAGSGYQALTWTNTGTQYSDAIPGLNSLWVVGIGQTADGILLNNAAGTTFDTVQAENLSGCGIHLWRVWDCTFANIRALRCGSPVAGKYAVALDWGNTIDQTNETTINRLQAEVADTQAIYVNPNCLDLTINTIHSERALTYGTCAGGTLTGTLTAGSPYVTGLSSLADIVRGAEVTGPGVPAGTAIAGLLRDPDALVLSQAATSGGAQALTIGAVNVATPPNAWSLGGNNVTIGPCRMEPANTAAASEVYIAAAYFTCTGLRSEGVNTTVVLNPYNTGAAEATNTLINPQISGLLQTTNGMTGGLALYDGFAQNITLNGVGSIVTVNGTDVLGVLTLGYVGGTVNRDWARQIVFTNCTIAAVASTSLDSQATFVRCALTGTVATLGYAIFRDCRVYAYTTSYSYLEATETEFGTYADNAGANQQPIARLDNCLIDAGAATGSAMATVFKNCRAPGPGGIAAGLLTAPTAGTWAPGECADRLVPVVGQPKGWRNLAAGLPGNWVSEGNL